MESALRRTCRLLVENLDVPSTVTSVRDLLPHIEEVSGRPIRLEPTVTNTAEPCGMWVRTTDVDHIFYDPRTSPAHADHIIAHELGHILRGHNSLAAAPEQPVTERFFNTLDPETVRMILGRTTYEYQDEEEAETIASLLQQSIHRRLPDAADRVARTLLNGRNLR
ncbi:toxin [Streptomyces sp. NPDC051662]|uniref:toxin n=1 Tax=Streptomyces sp. NPDC051662 TaxID=3154750 RepID=UPI0034310173